VQQPFTGRHLLCGLVGSFRGEIGAGLIDRGEQDGSVSGARFDGDAQVTVLVVVAGQLNPLRLGVTTCGSGGLVGEAPVAEFAGALDSAYEAFELVAGGVTGHAHVVPLGVGGWRPG